MSERRMGRRVSAALGVTALGLASIIGGTAAAYAAPQDFGDLDHDRIGSLTVHKYLHQSGTAQGDISVAPSAGDFTDPVANVVFTVYPLLKAGVPLDLAVPENWNGLDLLAPGADCTAPAGFTLGSPGTDMAATDADGAASIALAVGAYQVCETSAPPEIVDRAAPFIVTVPMPHENGWVYDVHAYPKNGAAAIEKTVEAPQDSGLGSIVRFPVGVPVSTVANPWTGFAIRDTFDPRLTPVAAADTVVTVDGVALDASYYTVEVVGQQVTMNFTAAGLAWLNEGPNSQAGKRIEVVFAGTVTTVGDGIIANTAELWPNNPGFDPAIRPPLPSNEVRSNWGDLQIIKRAAGTTSNEGTLQGATFEVYNADPAYAADCSASTPVGTAISVNGATTFTSAADGTISIAGLFVSDSEHDPKDATQRCYVLVETAAPAGYQLPANPNTAVAVQVGTSPAADVEIENTQQGVPTLPLTGANGQIIMTTAGIAALVVAAGLVLMKRRKTSQQ